MDLSDEQWAVRYNIENVTASLSVIGSLTIIFKILRDRLQHGSMTPYERVMLGLSICDLVASITWVWITNYIPRRIPAACIAHGFLYQLALSSWWYNCILSYYFLLTVLSQLKRKNFVRTFEPFLHLTTMFFPITAIIGLPLGWYDNDSCRVMDDQLNWIVLGIPTLFTLLSLIVNNVVIYAVVRKSLQTSATGLTSIQKRLKREARTLMFLYVGSFLLSFLPAFVLELSYVYGGINFNRYPLLIIQSIFLPLQGFFNFCIYIKPMYSRFRVACPNKPAYFVLHQALFNPNIPQIRASRGHTASIDMLGEESTNPNQMLFKSDFRPHSSSSSDSSSSSGSSSSSKSSSIDIVRNRNIEQDEKEEESDKGRTSFESPA